MFGNEAPYFSNDRYAGCRNAARSGLHRRLTLRNLLPDLNLNRPGFLRSKHLRWIDAAVAGHHVAHNARYCGVRRDCRPEELN